MPTGKAAPTLGAGCPMVLKPERIAAATIEPCGAIDILVNNAGLYASLPMRPFEQIPVAEWRLLFGGDHDRDAAEHTYGPGQPWFEAGPDPVLATTSSTEPSAFVRVLLLLPAEFAGQPTIRYVDPADAEKPNTQRARIFLEAQVRA